jgi:hypothetical protein
VASKTESAVVNVAGLAQGIVLVTFPALSTIFTEKSEYGCRAPSTGALPLTISFGEKDLAVMSAAVAGGIIAFYQLGYGIAAFGVGPLQKAGLSLSAIFGFTAIVAAVMGLLSFVVAPARSRPARPVTGETGSPHPAGRMSAPDPNPPQ